MSESHAYNLSIKQLPRYSDEQSKEELGLGEINKRKSRGLKENAEMIKMYGEKHGRGEKSREALGDLKVGKIAEINKKKGEKGNFYSHLSIVRKTINHTIPTRDSICLVSKMLDRFKNKLATALSNYIHHNKHQHVYYQYVKTYVNQSS